MTRRRTESERLPIPSARSVTLFGSLVCTPRKRLVPSLRVLLRPSASKTTVAGSDTVITVVGRLGLSPDCALAAVPGARDVPFLRSLRRLCPVNKNQHFAGDSDRQQQCDERSMAPAAERDRISRSGISRKRRNEATSASAWSRRTGLSRSTLYNRICRGRFSSTATPWGPLSWLARERSRRLDKSASKDPVTA